MRVECGQKPDECPECGRAPLACILYGLPAFDEELERDMAEGRVVLGGCCISGDDPAWQCTHCGLEIFRKQAP